MKSLYEAESDGRFLSRDASIALVDRIHQLGESGGRTFVGINSSWTGAIRFGRNRVSGAFDIRDTVLGVTRAVNGARGTASINRMDTATLDAAVRRAERLSSLQNQSPVVARAPTPDRPHATPEIWSDVTYQYAAQQRADAVRQTLSAVTKDPALTAAGYLQVAGHGSAWIEKGGPIKYYPSTTSQFSITVRDARANASGWAGLDHHDITKLDIARLTEIAIDKCVRSRNPVAIEPGRYTVVLEPQAVCDLTELAFINMIDRVSAEMNRTPYSSQMKGISRIGDQMFDRKIVVTTDPVELGYVPFRTSDGQVYRSSTWVDQGTLKQLAHADDYAVKFLGRNEGQPDPGSFRMSGGTATLDEMIQTTARGLLVTRFSNITIAGEGPIYTGYTRDGLWLIERGKVVKAVKNFRFLDSPFYSLNNVEQIGAPVRVFHPTGPVVVPPLKIRDFNMVSLVDAV
jgi:predicted Zn-dependent protease